jgi:hypothetical protein
VTPSRGVDAGDRGVDAVGDEQAVLCDGEADRGWTGGEADERRRLGVRVDERDRVTAGGRQGDAAAGHDDPGRVDQVQGAQVQRDRPARLGRPFTQV